MPTQAVPCILRDCLRSEDLENILPRLLLLLPSLREEWENLLIRIHGRYHATIRNVLSDCGCHLRCIRDWSLFEEIVLERRDKWYVGIRFHGILQLKVRVDEVIWRAELVRLRSQQHICYCASLNRISGDYDLVLLPQVRNGFYEEEKAALGVSRRLWELGL